MRFPRALVGAVLAGALLLTGGCSSPADKTGPGNYIEGDGSVVQIGVDQRDDAVAVSGETLTGETLDLADYRGQVVVINAWGSWCAPCNREMPMLVEAQEKLGDQVAFVGINVRDTSRDNALAFERTYGVDYPSLDGSTDPSLLLRFGGDFRPRNVPSTAVLDTEGRVAAVIRGEVPSVLTLVGVVEDVLAGKDPAADG